MNRDSTSWSHVNDGASSSSLQTHCGPGSWFPDTRLTYANEKHICRRLGQHHIARTDAQQHRRRHDSLCPTKSCFKMVTSHQCWFLRRDARISRSRASPTIHLTIIFFSFTFISRRELVFWLNNLCGETRTALYASTILRHVVCFSKFYDRFVLFGECIRSLLSLKARCLFEQTRE